MRIVEDKRPEKAEVVVEETRYVESDTALAPAPARARGGRKAEHPRAERRGAPRVSDRPGGARGRGARGRGGARRGDASRSSSRRRRSGSTGSIGSTGCAGSTSAVDLSATPFYLARAGGDTNRIFPWVVSEFGLTDAIESGLVKIPQLAVVRSDGRGARSVVQPLALDHGEAHRAGAGRSAREPEAGGRAQARADPDRDAREAPRRHGEGVGGGGRLAAAGLHRRLQEHEARQGRPRVARRSRDAGRDSAGRSASSSEHRTAR